MAISLDPSRIVDYVLESDRSLPSGEETVFQLKALDLRTEAHITDIRMMIDKEGRPHYKAGTEELEVLRAGLVGWTRFVNSAGMDLPCIKDPNGRISEASLALLCREYRAELAGAIKALNSITEAEKKS
jgi:hypothetical protein